MGRMALGWLVAAMCLPLWAAGVEDILGEWDWVTVMPQGGESEAIITFAQEGDALTALVGDGRGGGLPAENVSFADGKISWGLKVPQLQNAVVMTTVTVTGDTFTGSTKTPIGELPVRGKRRDAAALEAAKSAEEALIGDWTLYTEFEGEPIITKMRVFMNDEEGDDQGLAGVIIGRGGHTIVRRIQLDGEELSFRIIQPFISDNPASVRATYNEGAFEGTVRFAFGEMPISGEMIDTTKMVLAPYDDPSAVLGEWEVMADIDGASHPASLRVYEQDNRLRATLSGGGSSYEAEAVEYKKVSDTMGVLRLTVPVADLGSDAQVFELIVDGDGFEGEELHTGGTRVLTGKRKG